MAAARGWRPLGDVVKQAEAIGNMQYIQVREPRTKELKRVVKSMNQLARNSQLVMEEENKRLDLLRYKTQFDEHTDLPNRHYFLSILKGQLAFRDTEGVNCLFSITFSDKHGLDDSSTNHTLLNGFIDALSKSLSQLHHLYSDCRVGRIAHNQIAVLLTEIHAPDVIAEEIDNLCDPLRSGLHISGRQVVTRLRDDDTYKSVLARIDTLIVRAQASSSACYIADNKLVNALNQEDEIWWAEKLNEVIRDELVETFNFPVLDENRQLVHYQSWAGVEIDGKLQKSGFYTHWARYLGLLAKIERTTLFHLINYINRTNTSSKFAFLCSEQLMTDTQECELLFQALDNHVKAAHQLCIEVRENTAERCPEEFELFCKLLKQRGCEVGLKRVGESFSQLSGVQKLGLDYVKIDSAFINDIDSNLANHAFIRGFCSLAHAFGMKVYADGAKRSDFNSLFQELGIDGVVSHIEVIETLLDD